MGHHHDHNDDAAAYEEVTNAPHKSSLSHEAIAAAASFAAMKAYNTHCEKNGKPASHDTAKEIMAAAAGAFIDHIVETKGLDFVDKQKAKHHAKESAFEKSNY
ncbi:CipC-like protein [Rhizopogon salebrosus TDB-379]|nr:CipC-like protein [Rhizopogon salebrosus TDB-379]